MSEVLDLVILGGGCAGLNLSMALEANGERKLSTLVIESRNEYLNDRTWCFWGDLAKIKPYKIQHIWQTMRVSNGGRSVTLNCGSTPYNTLSGENFYTAALASIDRQPNITLRMGTSVISEPSFGEGVWTVNTSAGSVTARAIVDTRPPRHVELGGATLWQSFYGVEIECKDSVFDSTSLDLMNFLDPDPRHVPFVYVLPLTPTRALIEVTVFGAQPLGRSELSSQLESAVVKLVADLPYKTIRSEHGILPMGLKNEPQQLDSSYVQAGIMSGGARPSTGYAFQRIESWAHRCASSLVRYGLPIPHLLDPLPLRLMDQIFLEVLRTNPMRGGSIFFSLFGRAHPARVIRFLSGRGGVFDSLAVIAAVPFTPFIRAAFRLMWRAIRNSRIEKVA